jgi:hypothetical protein
MAPHADRCICDPNDPSDPPSLTPRAVEGCVPHVNRRWRQLWVERLMSHEARICGTDTEPDGDLCVGWLRFEPGDVQAKCDRCGGWTGRWAPQTAETHPGRFGDVRDGQPDFGGRPRL